jgi:hypothetical protein
MIPKMSKAKRGRKPLQDKKKLLALFIRESQLEGLGGIDQARKVLYSFIENQKP